MTVQKDLEAETREQMLARHAAELARMDTEPDYSELAWEVCVSHGYQYRLTHEHRLATAALRRGMELEREAALPLAPRKGPVVQHGIGLSGDVEEVIVDGIRYVRATLTRAPVAAWPGDKPTEPEWIDWHGGECPVPAGTRVALKFSGGGVQRSTIGDCWNWQYHEGDPTNIIAYRILPEGGAA